MNLSLLTILTFLSVLACSQKPIEDNMKGEERMGDKNILLVEQYFEHFNNHNWTKMANMYIDNAQFKDPLLGKTIVTQTKEEIINKYSELGSMFPDLRDELIKIYPSGGENIIVEFLSSGTAPDGNKFELPICTIFSFKNGLITKDFSYYDNFED